MGYRSEVYLKTTTEGFLILKKLDDSIEGDDNKPLYAMTIEKTKEGFYKISHLELKWYESFASVQNFNLGLEKLEAAGIPYSFIRIGEDHDDIEHKYNWTEDMPDNIANFEPVTEINDEDDFGYEKIDLKSPGGE